MNSRTIAWKWQLRNNGRPIDEVQISIDGNAWRAPDNRESHDQTFGYAETHRLRVRSHTAAGWSDVAGPREATTVPEPKNPEIYNVRFNSADFISFGIRDFPGNTSWNIVFDHKGYGGVHNSCCNVNVGPGGNGYTWAGDYDVAAKGGQLVITMSRPGSPNVTKTVRR